MPGFPPTSRHVGPWFLDRNETAIVKARLQAHVTQQFGRPSALDMRLTVGDKSICRISGTHRRRSVTNQDHIPPCYWLTPTHVMPHPYGLDAGLKPWTCLRSGCPRPLTDGELRSCATCPEWEARTFDAAKRDTVFETWGVGIPIPEERTYDEVRRELVWQTWGV
jgi:hypothetical protein